jgi:mannose-6-phosphate isomerase-like protein (cupin superfamily)
VKKVVFAAAALAFAISLAAQPAPPNGQSEGGRARSAQRSSPDFANGAVAFPVGRLRAQMAGLINQAKAKGSAERTLEDFGTYKLMLSVRGRSGDAEVHAHWDDVMIVEQGSAILVTGGRVIDGRTDADGETRGLRIDGGRHQSLGAGDILTVRAGIPHQLLLSPGTVFSAFVIKIHEH